MYINMDEVMKHITSIDKKTADILFNNKKTYNEFKFISKGGQGVVYKIDNYPYVLKIFLQNGETNELVIIKTLINKTYQNIIKFHKIHLIDRYVIIVMDEANGSVDNWYKTNRTDCEWIEFIMQILFGINIIQNELKMFHGDMKPKNILYKEHKEQQVFIYKIENKTYTIKSKYEFLISDFGHAVTVKHTGKYKKTDVENFIKANNDAYELSSIYKRIIVDETVYKYGQKKLLEMGLKDDRFIIYFNNVKNGIKKKFNKYPKEIKDFMIKRAIIYFLVERGILDLSYIKILPSKNIMKILDSLIFNDLVPSINNVYKIYKETCNK